MSQRVDPAIGVTSVPFDVVVVGAGINGLGIARDAAARGLRVAVVEQEDICSGVSAWSGRLIHGGLRYLEHKDFRLVRESLRERERLFRVAPHLVKPVPLLMPFYSKNKRPSWLIRMGMIAYDVLSFDKTPPMHRILSRDKVLARFGGMAHDGLGGAALFIDGQLEYAERLCVELAVAAVADGATLLTHCRVNDLIMDSGRVVGVHYLDPTGITRSLNASVVINAGGPWVDQVVHGDRQNPSAPELRLIGGSKGSHIVVDPFPGAPQDVVYYESQSDGRLVLVIPWMGRYLIGCTDTRYDADPSTARAEPQEVDYLLNEVNVLIPDAQLGIDDVLFTYSGVRPLPYAPGIPEWRIPRSHIVHDHAKDGQPGLLSIVSGKLTTYRQLAEDAVDLVYRVVKLPRVKTTTKESVLPGARAADLGRFRQNFLNTPGLDPVVARRLLDLYGVRSELVWSLTRDRPELAEQFDPDSRAIAAELVFAVNTEFATTLTDVMARRLMLAFEPKHGLAGVDRAAEIVGAELGWSDARRAEEIALYGQWLDHLAVPKSTPGGGEARPSPAKSRA